MCFLLADIVASSLDNSNDLDIIFTISIFHGVLKIINKGIL